MIHEKDVGAVYLGGARRRACKSSTLCTVPKPIGVAVKVGYIYIYMYIYPFASFSFGFRVSKFCSFENFRPPICLNFSVRQFGPEWGWGMGALA